MPLAPTALLPARRSWFDTAAAILGGARERCALSAVHSRLLTDASVPLRPWEEALVLGTASHALDYDDVCMLAVCHPSAPVVTALMALLPVIERLRPGLRFDPLLAAYLVGTETLLRRRPGCVPCCWRAPAPKPATRCGAPKVLRWPLPAGWRRQRRHGAAIRPGRLSHRALSTSVFRAAT